MTLATLKWPALTALGVTLLAWWVTHPASMSLAELVGTLAGIYCVVLAIEERIENFPLGIISNLAFALLFFTARLYGSMALQGLFMLLTAYGWYRWARGWDNAPLRVSRMTPAEGVGLLLVGVPATLGLIAYLRHIGDQAPVLGAITFVLTLCAQFLLNHKRVENWLVGVVVDALFIIMFVSQGLWLTAGLFAFYLGMCAWGLVSWWRLLRTQGAELPAPLPAAHPNG